MSTYVSVVISPDTTTSPVLTSVSHATRPYGSSRSTASRTPSEIWSAILSGWPSVTDSDVNRYSLSDSWLMGSGGRLRSGRLLRRATEAAPGGAPRAGAGYVRRLRVAARSACAPGASAVVLAARRPAPRAALVEVDHERHAVHAKARPQAVLQEVGV